MGQQARSCRVQVNPALSLASKTRKAANEIAGGLRKIGAGEEIRTLDSHLGKVVLYQLSYARLLKRWPRIHFNDLKSNAFFA